MGIDTCILIKTTDNLRPAVGGDFPESFYKDEEENSLWEVDTCCRWYSEGYERGPWPHISSILLHLFAAKNVKSIYYYGDSSLPEGPLTKERFFDLCTHYMNNGNRPYYE